MINSSAVTSESSTWYSSTSRIVSGGLKFHCWRTISRNELPPSEDHRKTNSCVRATSFSSKTSDIWLSFWGWSKTSRIVSVPGIAARQPRVSPEINADSTGKSLSSDVTSTTAARSRSSQLSPPEGTVSGVRVISRLRIQNSVYLWSHSQRLSSENTWFIEGIL